MTTSAREDRHAGPHTPAHEPDSAVAPPPRLRRRPGLVIAAVAVTALGGLLGAWAWTTSTSTHEVLAATHTIHRGEFITGDDIARIRISNDSTLTPLPGSAFDDVVGQRAALDIPSGSVLTAEATSADSMPPQGQSVVGISLTPAQVPAVALNGGDRVRIFLTPADGDGAAGSPQFTSAEVVDTAIDDTTGNTIVNVLVPYADAGVLAARSATGNVALVLDSGAK